MASKRPLVRDITSGLVSELPTGDSIPIAYLSGVQPLDADLTAIAALSSTGLLARTAADTWAQRTITGTAPISVSNGNGVAGNPVISHSNSTVTAGTYGSANQIPQFTVDALGHLTAAANVNIVPTALTYLNVTGTTTLTRTANTFTVITGMEFVTPPAGTYFFSYNGDIQAGNTNGQGEVACFLGGTQQTAYTRQIELNVALFLGLIGTALINIGAGGVSGIVTVNGSQNIDMRYRSVDGQTITITNRSMLLVRVA